MSEERKRGAQSGNQNARKHPLYVTQPPAGGLDLTKEISLLRQYMQRIIVEENPAQPGAAFETLRLLIAASFALARLARTQSAIFPPQENEMAAEIGRMVDEMRRELAVRSIDAEDEAPAPVFPPPAF